MVERPLPRDIFPPKREERAEVHPFLAFLAGALLGLFLFRRAL